ncbi:translation initiation factor IF-2-like [Stegodyphus dumicola]|uniref:translation initiation factor IF-2-like n=1 Tax=Stegodyphus dumicola TaxID=202533 RepID=UPI0015ABB3C6|nr:translation initiation factor IF-2-like [Stegodyphus dumicola]
MKAVIIFAIFFIATDLCCCQDIIRDYSLREEDYEGGSNYGHNGNRRPLSSGYYNINRPMSYGNYEYNRPMSYGYSRPMSYGYSRPMSYGYNRLVSNYGYSRPMSYGNYGYSRPMSYGYSRPVNYGGYSSLSPERYQMMTRPYRGYRGSSYGRYQ